MLAGLYRRAELGNATRASHFQPVSMVWTACSLAVTAMAFLCSLLLGRLERKKPLQVSTGRGGFSQRVTETFLSHVGSTQPLWSFILSTFGPQYCFIIPMHSFKSYRIWKTYGPLFLLLLFSSSFFPLQKSLNIKLLPIVNCPNFRTVY